MIIALLAAIVLSFEPSAGCTLVHGQVDFVPPDIARAILVEQCGSVTCWRRWLEIDGRRVGESRVCDRASNSSGSPLKVTPP